MRPTAEGHETWQPSAANGHQSTSNLSHVQQENQTEEGSQLMTQAHSDQPMSPQAQSPSSGPLAPMEIQEALLPAGRPEFTHPFSIGRRRYMIFVYTLLASLLFADQNLLAPNLTEAAEFFGFDEDEKDQYLGGYISAGFFAVGAPAALLIGWLTDKINRRNLLFWVVLFGSAPCLCTYWVNAYWEFFLLRLLTGISVGGCFPLLYSLLGDLFPPTSRSLVSAFVQIATGAGIFVGQALSSWIAPATNWRLPFVVVAIPAMLVNIAMVLTTKEPPRGACEDALKEQYADGDQYRETITWAKVKVLLKVPSNWFIIMQGLPGSLPWGMMLTYFNDYLSYNKGFSVQVATLIVTVFGIGGAVGVIGGGALGQWLYNRKKEWMIMLASVTVWLGMGPMFYLINADLKSLSIVLTCFVAIVGGCLASVAGPNLRAVMLNVNDPEARGVASALQTMTDDLGKAMGPVIVAAFIKDLGRTGAFNVSVCGWILCGFLLGALIFTMRKDEAAMQTRLQRKVEAQARNAAAQQQGLDMLPVPSGPDDSSPIHRLSPGPTAPQQTLEEAGSRLITSNSSHLQSGTSIWASGSGSMNGSGMNGTAADATAGDMSYHGVKAPPQLGSHTGPMHTMNGSSRMMQGHASGDVPAEGQAAGLVLPASTNAREDAAGGAAAFAQGPQYNHRMPGSAFGTGSGMEPALPVSTVEQGPVRPPLKDLVSEGSPRRDVAALPGSPALGNPPPNFAGTIPGAVVVSGEVVLLQPGDAGQEVGIMGTHAPLVLGPTQGAEGAPSPDLFPGRSASTRTLAAQPPHQGPHTSVQQGQELCAGQGQGARPVAEGISPRQAWSDGGSEGGGIGDAAAAAIARLMPSLTRSRSRSGGGGGDGRGGAQQEGRLRQKPS